MCIVATRLLVWLPTMSVLRKLLKSLQWYVRTYVCMIKVSLQCLCYYVRTIADEYM